MLVSAFLIGIVTSLGWWTGSKITDKIESIMYVEVRNIQDENKEN